MHAFGINFNFHCPPPLPHCYVTVFDEWILLNYWIRSGVLDSKYRPSQAFSDGCRLPSDAWPQANWLAHFTYCCNIGLLIQMSGCPVLMLQYVVHTCRPTLLIACAVRPGLKWEGMGRGVWHSSTSILLLLSRDCYKLFNTQYVSATSANVWQFTLRALYLRILVSAFEALTEMRVLHETQAAFEIWKTCMPLLKTI